MTGHEQGKFAGRSDQQLLRNYQSGQAEAFAVLVERYRLELFHFLARFVNDRIAAEDIFQEAFLQVHLSADSFDHDRPFKPWLFTIAANKARDYLRRNNRRAGQLTSLLASEDSDSGKNVVDLIDGDLPSPNDLAQSKETREMVRSIIARLPDHLREILLLAYFHQVPYKDIAHSLGIPLGTVKSRLHAAVASFASAWKQAYPALAPPQEGRKQAISDDFAESADSGEEK